MALVLDQFIRNLRESRLISPEEVTSLEKALQASAANSNSTSKTPRTVEEVAKLLVQSGKLTHFQAATISQGRQQSLILGEYVLLDVLGKGGMGVVFRARHRLMDRVVAVKTLPAAKIKADSIPRFYREVKAAARLSHPNIVTAFDAGDSGGTHYLVMEYVRGRDLSAIIKEKGPLPLRQAIDYTQQTARGLEYAHKQGVVHRDVKPSNLLLDQAGVIKILDMGLARLSENLVDAPQAAELTGAGQILGTVDYMSPEQAVDVHAADHLSDIYSLGCTLFYFLTRRAVYAGENIVQRILAHRDDPVPSVMESRPDCPPTLDALIRRMLAKRPADRPQSMTEIITALETCLANPGAAPPPVVGPPVITSPKRSSPARSTWLENLVSAEAAHATDDSQIHERTLGSRDDVHSAPPRPGAGGTATVYSTITRRSSEETTASGAGKSWKIIAGLAAVLLAAGGVAAVLFTPAGRSLWMATPDPQPGPPPAEVEKSVAEEVLRSADPLRRRAAPAEMEKAVADAGSLVRVRKDGQGDAKTIQAAVNKASPNAVIEIEDAGPWSERIVIPAEKEGLTICGKKGILPLSLPVLTTAGTQNGITGSLLVHARQLSLERLAIVSDEVAGQPGMAVAAAETTLSLRGVIVHGRMRVGKLAARQSVCDAGVGAQGDIDAKDSVFLGPVGSKSSCAMENVLVNSFANCGPGSSLRHCTIIGLLQLTGRVSDSILTAITADDAGQTIENCDVYGKIPYRKKAIAGKGSFTKPPMFVGAQDLDFNLHFNSPCRKAASDGSDLGFVAAADVQALLRRAEEWRNRVKGKQ